MVLIAVALMIGSGGTAMQQLAFQATPGPTPTPEELEERRDQAIADGVDQLELTFDEFNDSGIEGTATFYDLDDETLVSLAITGGGEAHPAYILEGTCGNTEPEPVERLSEVDDTGESLSLIEMSLTDLIDSGDYVVDLRLSPNDLGVLIACANIEGTVTPATPAAATPAAGTPEAETPVAEPTGEGGIVETPTPAATSTPEPTATATATADATEPASPELDGTGGPEAAPGTVASLPLGDYSGLGVTGTVTLIAIDDSTTRLRITLTGDAVTGGHVAHLHPGTCDDLQDDGTIYLASVGTDGISETTVMVSLNELLTGSWSVNVHPSEANWDTWMVCGFLGDATDGTTGDDGTTPGTGGTVPTPTPVSGVSQDDGTGGVISGKGSRTTTTLTQGVGVGSAIPWPESTAQSVAWALGIFALVLAGAAGLLRYGQNTNRQPTRWQRLGL